MAARNRRDQIVGGWLGVVPPPPRPLTADEWWERESARRAAAKRAVPRVTLDAARVGAAVELGFWASCGALLFSFALVMLGVILAIAVPGVLALLRRAIDSLAAGR